MGCKCLTFDGLAGKGRHPCCLLAMGNYLGSHLLRVLELGCPGAHCMRYIPTNHGRLSHMLDSGEVKLHMYKAYIDNTVDRWYSLRKLMDSSKSEED